MPNYLVLKPEEWSVGEERRHSILIQVTLAILCEMIEYPIKSYMSCNEPKIFYRVVAP